MDWGEYAKLAQRYLNRPVFAGTPLKGQDLADAARLAFETYGIVVPPELALAQAQFETSMGRRGRNPKTNPFNVGEWDTETKLRFPDTSYGVNKYFDLMARDYLNNKPIESLLTNFVNQKGNRYAVDPNYEKKISKQVNFIKRYLKI
jgi:flagellum-specific peptidoglycan hydrolase FlgJ